MVEWGLKKSPKMYTNWGNNFFLKIFNFFLLKTWFLDKKFRKKGTVMLSFKLHGWVRGQKIAKNVLKLSEQIFSWKKFFKNFFHQKRDFWTKNLEIRGPLCCPLSYMAEWGLKKSQKMYLNWVNKFSFLKKFFIFFH